ncbi:hypothetical protein GCM10009563_07760 [Subtercola frigoramans]
MLLRENAEGDRLRRVELFKHCGIADLEFSHPSILPLAVTAQARHEGVHSGECAVVGSGLLWAIAPPGPVAECSLRVSLEEGSDCRGHIRRNVATQRRHLPYE